MADKVQVQGGMGLLSWLTVAFVVLKLTGHIDWSWWIVLSPVLVSIGLWVVILALAIAVAVWGD